MYQSITLRKNYSIRYFSKLINSSDTFHFQIFVTNSLKPTYFALIIIHSIEGVTTWRTNYSRVLLNAAARLSLVSCTRNYDRGLSQILHADLHWLDVVDRVWYKLGVTVHQCLHNKAPQYLVDCCVPVSDRTEQNRTERSTLPADHTTSLA